MYVQINTPKCITHVPLGSSCAARRCLHARAEMEVPRGSWSMATPAEYATFIWLHVMSYLCPNDN